MEYDEYYRTFEIEEMKQRANELLGKKAEERQEKFKQRQRDLNDINAERLKAHRERYEKSEKGKIKCKERSERRRLLVLKLYNELTKEEKKAVRNFYRDRPEGLHVDHIIPLSKGGRHHVSNLRYVTPRQNRKKAAILNFKLTKTI